MRRNQFTIGAAMMCLAASAFIAQSADAGGTLYAIDDRADTLVRIDLDTLELTSVGPLGVDFDFGGLAYDPNSQALYMCVGTGGRALYRVNPITGAATLVGEHGVYGMNGLAFDTSTNTLYGTNYLTPCSLYELDITNGSKTLVGTDGVRIGGLAYDSRNNRLIGINDGNSVLYEISRVDGSQQNLRRVDYTNNSGLAYDPERRVLWCIDWNGDLIYYDVDFNFRRVEVLSGLQPHDGLTYVGEPIEDCLYLTTSTLVAGEVAMWNVGGAIPAQKVAIVYGHAPGQTSIDNYAGYCVTFAINAVTANRVICRMTADSNGSVTCARRVPGSAAGARVLSQAAMQGTCPDECVSNLVDQIIQ